MGSGTCAKDADESVEALAVLRIPTKQALMRFSCGVMNRQDATIIR